MYKLFVVQKNFPIMQVLVLKLQQNLFPSANFPNRLGEEDD